MSELLDLYQEVILDHNRAPHNYRRLPNANRTALGHNPLCGDQLTLYMDVEDGLIKDVSFLGSGCAISKASASIMTDALKGKTTEDAEALFSRFHEMLTGPPDVKPDPKGLGKLAVFAGVREFPVRVKCATLAWHTAHSALQGETSASTEV
ncbi:MAG TPA: SUF system NifU family Fe-S cluster assembly protein [Thermoanaerobaculia bacterium]|nr:SUF system NifU family Fe-S cluster assembly protein [Thermoanaerobaculia bacterium]